ncbi:sortase [Streptomyces sp. NBC_01476]|uniref:sortase domain-containing protein n=1 Tax=Streptomyces sp. NBC_01476 TaxID=2903881 RepID=UPI002E335A20|nr:sortase [Streptomyces sp. NBC_01476]
MGVLTAALLGCSATAATGVSNAAPARPVGGPAAHVPAATASPSPTPTPSPTPPPVNRKTATAELTIPSIGIKNLRIVPYEGTTDDWPGTRIQDRSLAASPYGPHGGVGPGEIGNYLVTGHRLSAGGPLNKVPSLKAGQKVLVTTGGTTYTYTVTETRKTDFRSARSLAEQRAPVPGHPGEKPTKAMITVSTCATPEDNAAGNFWRDAKNNPQHRIDKIGVLTSWSKAPAGS